MTNQKKAPAFAASGLVGLKSEVSGPEPTLNRNFSEQQIEALARIEEWRRRRDDKLTYYLGGYAGTGKTTLAASIDGAIAYGAFTGKAAAVMRAKGCANADTIDALIYRPHIEHSCAKNPPCVEPPGGCPTFGQCRYLRGRFAGRELNPESKVTDADLVIIDEVSMVGREMAEDLLSFDVPVLIIGDPAQLPPIGEAGYFTSREPDYLLTEVHRQALDSPVIKLATIVRDRIVHGRGWLRHGRYGDSAVVPRSLPVDELLRHHQIIVGTHRTRCRLNREIREALGYDGDLPLAGEKLLCLRNHRDKGLRNGTLWTVVEVRGEDDVGFIDLVVADEKNDRVEVAAPIEAFLVEDGSGGELSGDPFTYGYAITCHKAQGSQWKSVAVIDESHYFHRYRWNWLYTAITRASERVTVETP